MVGKLTQDVKKLEKMFSLTGIQVEPIKINQDKNELAAIANDLVSILPSILKTRQFWVKNNIL